MDIANILLLINGLLCLFMPQHIANLLPYLLGGSMTISGIIRIRKCSKQKLEEKQKKLRKSCKQPAAFDIGNILYHSG